VSSVDWEQGRATVEDILQRTSELVDPAVANVDHALLVFALDSPPVRHKILL
jgi:ribosome biogenesis GTPase